MEDLKRLIVERLKSLEILNSDDLQLPGKDLHGCILSLSSRDIISYDKQERVICELTPEGREVVDRGSPEFVFYNSIPDDGVSVADCDGRKIGKAIAFRNGWVCKRGDRIFKAKSSVSDDVCTRLKNIEQASEEEIRQLQRRNLVVLKKTCYYLMRKGRCFGEDVGNLETEITAQMVVEGRSMPLKPFNFHTDGLVPQCGALHPLTKFKTEIKHIFVGMGFVEMDTSHYVESAFWNFDSLFMSQHHPSRDSSETFYLESSTAFKVPEEYFKRVHAMHESGGFGSAGYQTKWSPSVANRLLLRTHTTSESARCLFKMAQAPFKPVKMFSVDRVFRNEAVDSTHLAEFHQVEGLVVDKGLRLGHLMGTLEEFYRRMNLTKIRFKPAYNPYTEPSMEVFAYHEGMGKWIEVGNSGFFRPEMLRTMGFEEDVRVMAWGLSVERPAMIKYKLDNIRDLLGHRVNVNFIKANGICKL